MDYAVSDIGLFQHAVAGGLRLPRQQIFQVDESKVQVSMPLLPRDHVLFSLVLILGAPPAITGLLLAARARVGALQALQL